MLPTNITHQLAGATQKKIPFTNLNKKNQQHIPQQYYFILGRVLNSLEALGQTLVSMEAIDLVWPNG